jgi:hypothetical protein
VAAVDGGVFEAPASSRLGGVAVVAFALVLAPHLGQKAKSGAQRKPQLEQPAGWRAPHFGQKAKPLSILKPQSAQSIEQDLAGRRSTVPNSLQRSFTRVNR